MLVFQVADDGKKEQEKKARSHTQKAPVSWLFSWGVFEFHRLEGSDRFISDYQFCTLQSSQPSFLGSCWKNIFIPDEDLEKLGRCVKFLY